MLPSYSLPLRRRFRKAGRGKGECTKVIHGWKAEGQGRCYEGNEVDPNPGAGELCEGEAVKRSGIVY